VRRKPFQVASQAIHISFVLPMQLELVPMEEKMAMMRKSLLHLIIEREKT